MHHLYRNYIQKVYIPKLMQYCIYTIVNFQGERANIQKAMFGLLILK